MAAQQFLIPFRPVINLKGGLEAGAILEIYESGGLTPFSIYADADLTDELPNPLTANGFGVFPSVYFDETQSIRAILKQANGTVIDDVDPYLGDGLPSSSVVFIASGEDSSVRDVQEKLRDTVNIADFGGGPAKTGAQNSAAYAAAIAAVGAAGGGDIWTTEPGVYLLNDTNPSAVSWDNRRCIYINQDNIALRFAKGVTLKLADNQDAHVIQIGSRTTEVLTVDNVLIEGVRIDGNRANQVTPDETEDHQIGIVVQSDCTNITIRDFHISQCVYYGIGFQRAGFINCTVENGVIEDVGADGFDAKDDGGLNRGNVIRNVKVRRHGLAAASLDPNQVGIGVRGGWFVSACEVTDFDGDRHGIRIDASDTSQNTFQSQVSNCYIEASAVGTTVGLFLNNPTADDCSVIGVRVRGCALGFDSRANRNQLANCIAASCTTGFQVFQRNQLANCIALSCTTGLLTRGNLNVMVNFQARSCTTGANIASGNADNKFLGGEFSDNGTNVSDSGTRTSISQVIGVGTDRVGSATFTIDSTGRKAVVVPHQLDFTPAIADCTPYIVAETAVTDARYSAPEVVSADATNVSVAVDVTTASATGGALARMVVRSRAKTGF